MDKFGAALCRVTELREWQRIDAPAATVARLEDRHLPSGVRQLSAGHQAGSARADDQKMSRVQRAHQVTTSETAAVPTTDALGIPLPESRARFFTAASDYRAALDHLDRAAALIARIAQVPPGELYKDGLNRALFLPFIAMLEQHMTCLQLAAPPA